jgi:3-methyl-2-oxobutanoate hydroxymethyltransferase
MARLTPWDIRQRKGGQKIAMVTAHDYLTARLAERGGVDVVLVGDSLAMVALGHPDTLAVTLEEMLHHTRAVARGLERALLVGDMPFMSYQASVEEAVRNAGRFIKEGGAQAVKLEGGRECLPQIRALLQAGIPVMGHLGLLPQRAVLESGYRVQGRRAQDAREIIREAEELAEAGVFALVLECVPREVAAIVTRRVPCPVIGIGAGPECDGQVLVLADLLGLYERLRPRFVRRYAELGSLAAEAVSRFVQEVREGAFPGPEESYSLSREEREALLALLGEAGET